MSRFLYAWELGNNLGHAGSFLPLARSLRERGHEIHWVLTEPATQLLAAEGFVGIQAPRFPEIARSAPPLSYNEILLRFGYAQAQELLGLVLAWRELIQASRAQVILADHAPTAILAARTLGVPVMVFSYGFCVPPRQRPLPGMRPWQALPSEQLAGLERRVLDSINPVLSRFGCTPIDATAQLFDVAEDTLLGFPELDHYAERGPARYWGNLPDPGVGTALTWPQLPGRRIFAYLRGESPHHETALDALHNLGHPAIVCFPDVSPALIERYSAPHLVLSPAPFNLAQAARDADAGITYGSVNTTTCMLLAGKPLLLLPAHLEQFLLSRCVENMGAGLLAHPERPAADLPAKLREILREPAYASNAQAFARKYAGISQTFVTANLVRRIEEIAAEGVSNLAGTRPLA